MFTSLFRLLAIGLVALVLIGCGAPSQGQIDSAVQAALAATTAAVVPTATPDPCSSVTLTAYADTLERTIDDYARQARLTSTTPRVGIGTPLQRLLDLATEAQDMDVPPCVKAFHESVIGGMKRYQQGYENFAMQGTEEHTNAMIKFGDEAFALAHTGIVTLRAGTVPEAFKP